MRQHLCPSGSSQIFLFDFQLSDSPFGGVVVGWYRSIFKEVEDVAATS